MVLHQFFANSFVRLGGAEQHAVRYDAGAAATGFQHPQEKREEKLDEMKLERAIERAMIEGTDEAVEEAERIKRQNDSPDIQMTDMVDLADSADLKKSVDQNLGDIKSSMKVLEADLKGIKVDEKA